ncbi:MAG TPA: DUF2071 domain-containing protein [Actinomycetes bacterium]|jgi:uncharacterized protein YqjF (DUF2071 family)|nr:DUF2071 domain-containing protein [Actinomycetes bacterium]
MRTHPLAMTAGFRDLLVITYAFPAAVLEPLVPSALTLDHHQGHGFLAIALVDTAGLRPSAAPPALGIDASFIGYRIFIRARLAAGRRRRGLYVLRTNVDRWVVLAGTRLLTRYRTAHARIRWQREGDRLEVRVRSPRGRSDLRLTADLGQTPPQPPAGSPFSSWAQARPFAGPLPWTFAPEAGGEAAVTVKGTRDRWDPQPLAIEHADVALLDQPPFAAATPKLAAAFHLHDLTYNWTAGKVEPLAAGGAHVTGALP